MANWTTLKTAIANVIKTNGNQEITGQLLQNVLNNIVSSVGENSTFAGIATPATNPDVPDGPVFYIATTVGVYANFDGVSVADGEAVILQWNGGAWTKKTTRLATEQEIIYDVSARNGGVVFKSLSALLSSSNLSTLIPTSVRHGGMSIRFIQGSEQSSDNNYVQARLIAQSFTTNITKWQSVDEEPKVGSHNLVESGGVLIKNNVLHYTSSIDSAIWGDKLDISNIPNGTIIYFTIKHTYPVNTGSAGFGIYNSTTSPSTRLASLTVGTISQFVKTDSISTIRLYIAPTSQAGDVALFMGVDKELLIENVVELYSLSSLTKKGYLYKAYATPSTNPNVVSGEKVFYIAAKRGNYVNFNNINVPFTYNTYILKYDGSSWSYDVVENIKYDSKFSSCYIVNQLIKELYVVKQPQAFTNALYVYQIVSGTNGLWRISFNQVGSTTGSYTFDFDEETNGLIHLSKGELEIYAVLDWSAILNNSIFTFTDTEAVLRNEKNVEFSPTIELAIKNYDNQIAQIHNLNQRQYIRILSLGLNAFIPIQYGFIAANGNYASNDDFYISDFIPVSEGNKVYFTGKYKTTSVLGAVWGYTDENYSNPIMILGWTQATFENEEITIPASVNFIKAWSRKGIQPILSFINSAITPEPSEYNVTVKKDSTGDFTSIVDAVHAVTDTSKPNNIHIYPGTYDMISEYFGDSDYTDTSDVGLVLPNNVNLIGCGKKENVIIEANFPSTIKYNTSNHFSPIHLKGRNNKLQNLTVQCFNCRYPVHDQAASNDNKEYLHEYVDVILIHNGFDSGAIVTTESVTEENNDTSHRWGSCHALGQGTYKTATIICERCEFICNAAGGVPYFTHDAQEHLEQGVTILLSECKLVSTKNRDIIVISSLGEGYSNSMTLRNCKFISANKSIVGKIYTPGTEFVYTIYGNKENGVTINLPTGYEDNDWTI